MPADLEKGKQSGRNLSNEEAHNEIEEGKG